MHLIEYVKGFASESIWNAFFNLKRLSLHGFPRSSSAGNFDFGSALNQTANCLRNRTKCIRYYSEFCKQSDCTEMNIFLLLNLSSAKPSPDRIFTKVKNAGASDKWKNPFSSPESLGLVCNEPRFKTTCPRNAEKRRALGTRMRKIWREGEKGRVRLGRDARAAPGRPLLLMPAHWLYWI